MEDKDFIVNIGPQGTFKPSGMYQTFPSDVDRIFQSFDQNNIRKIAIYIHGGLVNEKSGVESARAIVPTITNAGAAPICIVWETGLLETITNNVSRISSTSFFEKVRNAIIKRVSEKLGFNGSPARASATPISDNEIEAEIKKEHPFANYTTESLRVAGRGGADLAATLADEYTLEAELEKEFTGMIENDRNFQRAIDLTNVDPQTDRSSRGILSTAKLVKSLVAIAIRILKRFYSKRDHDFYPTLIEEILRELYVAEVGAWVWDCMKVKSVEMFNKNLAEVSENSFAGSYLLKKLGEYSIKYPDLEVDLIGHSAGSILICNMIRNSQERYPNLAYRNLIFLAPACRMDLFTDEILSRPNSYSRIRIFTMTDENEKRDVLVKFVYTHSLLYLISGILEEGGKSFDEYILGMERFYRDVLPYQNESAIRKIKDYLYEMNQGRIVLSQTSVGSADGFRTQSLKHGDFHTDQETLESIGFILKSPTTL